MDLENKFIKLLYHLETHNLRDLPLVQELIWTSMNLNHSASDDREYGFTIAQL